MEQCFDWLSRPSNQGKLIDQKILSLLMSSSRGEEGPPPALALAVCRLLVRRLLQEVVIEHALSSGLALCCALLSSGLGTTPWWRSLLKGRVLHEEQQQPSPPSAPEVTAVSDVCVLGICHGTVNTALYESLDEESELPLLVDSLASLCRRPSRLTTTALRVLTTAVCRLPPERTATFLLPVVRFGWNGPANSPREVRRLLETFLLQSRPAGGGRTVQEAVLELSWGSRVKLLGFSTLWSVCARERVLECDGNLPEKLCASLWEPDLVSAGTDAYLAFIRHVTDAEDWWAFFSRPLLPLLLSSDTHWDATRALFTHWLPPTLRKFPSLCEKLRDAVPGDDDAQLCSLVLLHNEASKITPVPVQVSPDKTTDAVSRGLSHDNETVRLAAFSLVCRGFTPQLEDTVRSFLRENVTCDSVPLRQGILSAFRILLQRLVKQTQTASVPDGGTMAAASFLSWLHAFLRENLTVGVGNYQRRHLSLLLFGCVLRAAEQQKGTLPVGGEEWSTGSAANLQLLLSVLVWDPAKNIRQEAGKVLGRHFIPGDPHLRCRLAVRGLHACRSAWFFRAEVALEVFTLLSTAAWLGAGDNGVCHGCLEEGGVFRAPESGEEGLCSAMRDALRCSDPRGRGHVPGWCPEARASASSHVDELFYSLFYDADKVHEGQVGGGGGGSTSSGCTCGPPPATSLRLEDAAAVTGHKLGLAALLLWEAGRQWRLLQRDPVGGDDGAVHGVLQALTAVPVDHFSSDQVHVALALVEDLADWVLALLAAHSSGLSPSFADMGVALSSLADHLGDSHPQPLHLSPAFQAALNCLWLNLKACCDVAAHLGPSPGADADVAVRFLRVVTCVLTRCRHKGAIEAAGRALAAFVNVLTADNSHRATRTGVPLRGVPGQLLAAILDLLLRDSAAGGGSGGGVSLTRRSAGVAILVHRMVLGDAAYGHPLLELCVKRLVDLAARPLDPEWPATVDSAQARAVHCLTALVREASLRTQLSAYLGELTLLCLDTLLHSHDWNLRNAGLQLYSCVVPRVASGSSLEAVSWRYPSLGARLQQAASAGGEVPWLTLLARLSCDADSAPSRGFPRELLHRLRALYTEARPRQVRLLAAKAYARGVPLLELPGAARDLLAECRQDQHHHGGWNGLHGRLLCLEAALTRLQRRGVEVELPALWPRPPPPWPWPCREVLDRVRRLLGVRHVAGDLQELMQALRTPGLCWRQPGFFPWAEARAADVLGNSTTSFSSEEEDASSLLLLPLLTGADLDARCLDVCAAALLRSRPPPPPPLLLEALALGARSPELELGLVDALSEVPGGAVTTSERHEALLEELAGRHPGAALPLLTRASSPSLLRRCARRLVEDADAGGGEHAAALLLSADTVEADVAEALLGAAHEEDATRLAGRVLGPRGAASFLWRRLADVGGVLEACCGGGRRCSPFGQEGDAPSEEPCIAARATRDALVQVQGVLTPELDVATLADAVAKVIEANRDDGTYLALSAARLLSVKLGLLGEVLSSSSSSVGAGRHSALCDTLRSLREEVDGCLSGLLPSHVLSLLFLSAAPALKKRPWCGGIYQLPIPGRWISIS